LDSLNFSASQLVILVVTQAWTGREYFNKGLLQDMQLRL